MANLTWNIAMKIITIIKLHIKVMRIQRNEKICVLCFVLLVKYYANVEQFVFIIVYNREWAMKS